MPRNPYKYYIVDAGMLKHRITIQSLSAGVDEVGQQSQTWGDLGTFWGLYRNMTGKEALVAKQMEAEAQGVVTFREIPVTPDETMRLLFDGHTLGIVNVDLYSAGDGTKRQVVCWVSEVRP
jgi:SPP1 family predicted phage head-tail adaptor